MIEEILANLNRMQLHELDPGRFPGMPLSGGMPPFQVLTYRSPRGSTVDHDIPSLDAKHNPRNMRFVAELVMGSSHSGTHVDGLNHFTRGPNNAWYGGVSADEALGDFGSSSEADIPAFIGRGVLVDVAAFLGVKHLRASHPISLKEFRDVLVWQQIQLREGDIVLVRTGMLADWPDGPSMSEGADAGITFDVADYCAQVGVVAVGADTPGCEVFPTPDPTNPVPVHERLLLDAGIYIFENVWLESLSRARAFEFIFLALPLKIRGSTGSMIRPVALCPPATLAPTPNK